MTFCKRENYREERASEVAQRLRIHLPMQRCGFNPWIRKTPWRRKWQPTPVFLPGKSHGQRSLVGCSPWGCKELDMNELLSVHTHTHTGKKTGQWLSWLRVGLRR